MTNWIMDYRATHHITHDLDQLHLTQLYQGHDQIIVVDVSGLPIALTSETNLHTPFHTLHLSISVDFLFYHFLLKDLKTRFPLLRGQLNNGLYHMPHPSFKPKAFITTNHPPWHHILGHPFGIMRHLFFLHEIKSNSPP